MARRPLFIVAGVLALAVALFFGVQYFNGGGLFAHMSSVTVSAAETLRITSSQGDVTVRARAEASDITVKQKLQRSEAAPVTGDSATLTIDSTGVCPLGSLCSVDLEVTVPVGTVVHAEGGAGDVTLSGDLGEVTVVTGAGDVSVKGSGAPLRVRTGTGDIDVSLPAGGYAVTTSAGVGDVDVDADVTKASDGVPVDLTTGAGDIEVSS